MRRGTTPTHTFTSDIDLRAATVLFITYSQKGHVVIEKSLEDVTINEDSVVTTLTQAETLRLITGDVNIQIRAGFEDGSRIASNIITTSAKMILKDGEI